MTTAIDTNKTVARRFYDEVITAGNLALLDDIIAEDGHDSAVPAGNIKGREGFVEHITWLRANVEGVTAIVTDIIAEDDRAVVYWTIEGTQRGEIFGVPNSGKHFFGESISTIRFRDGRIAEYAVLPDRLGIISQLSSRSA